MASATKSVGFDRRAHMSLQVETSRSIAATPERVYTPVSDVTKMGEWSPEATSCRWPGAGPARFGRRGWARKRPRSPTWRR
jgi:hypothetical protein